MIITVRETQWEKKNRDQAVVVVVEVKREGFEVAVETWSSRSCKRRSKVSSLRLREDNLDLVVDSNWMRKSKRRRMLRDM